MRLIYAIPLVFFLTACATTPEPGIEVRVVERVVEVQKPCPGEKPERPAPLERPLPTTFEQLAAVLAAKLAEYAAPGMFADQADAIMVRCLGE